MMLIAFVLLGVIDLRFAVVALICMVAPSCVSCKLCEKKCPLGIVPYVIFSDYSIDSK
jgi:ferredoxin